MRAGKHAGRALRSGQDREVAHSENAEKGGAACMIDDNFMNEVIYAIAPYVENRDLSDIRMRLAITLSKYDVKKQETELIPYEGDVNIEILKRFLMAKTARGLSKRTLELYKNSISMTLAKIGKPYSQVTAAHSRCKRISSQCPARLLPSLSGS